MTSLADPRAIDMTPDAQASQWQLTWKAFRKHKLAVVSLVIVILFYLIGAFAEFVAPTNPESTSSQNIYHPPQAVQWIDWSADGSWAIRPHVQGMTI